MKNPAIRTRMVWRGSDTNTDTTQGPPGTLSRMASDLQLRGVYIPLITPFAADGSVALDAVTLLCHEYLDAGATGIVALGHDGRVDRARARRRSGRSSTRARRSARERAAQLIVGAGHEQHRARRSPRCEALAGTPALVGDAHRRAVLRAAVGGRDRRPLPGGRRRAARCRSCSTTSRSAPAAT